MTPGSERNSARGLAALRRLIARQPAGEHCDLCATGIPAEHQHLVNPQNRRLVCVCQACAILFSESGVTSYRRVPQDIRELVGFQTSDAFWNGLAIPIGLVFFFRSSASATTLALYPSPAGPAETSVDDDDWSELASAHPALATLRPDVEALLVNRMHNAREYYIVPIDECYKLTGVIRQHWSGFSGGDEAWNAIHTFFAELKRRARPERLQACA